MSLFWDDRFSGENYIYGEAPNQQFKEFIDSLPKGTILLPGEGEGRNAVYAALKGWNVIALDQSVKGKEKALALANKMQVNIDYRVEDLLKSDFSPGSFDAIALVFLHLPEEIRKKVHCYLQELLKPGGKLLLVGFSKDQLTYSSGGPKNIDMLYTCDMLNNDFTELSVEQNVKEMMELNEGLGHNGSGSVITFKGHKRVLNG